MYSRINTKTYSDIPYTNSHFHCCPNYVYSSVEDLAELETRESFEQTWCRTVGILQSSDGYVTICGINSTGGVALHKNIQVSMVYIESQNLTKHQSLVMPSSVQIFGSIQCNGGKPVIYAKLIQVLTASEALQMKDIMDHLIDFKYINNHRSIKNTM